MFWGCLFALLSCTSSPMLPLSRRFKVIWVAFPSVTSGVNGVEDAAEDGVKVMDSCPVRPWELGKTWGKSVVLQLPSTSYFLHVFCHEKKNRARVWWHSLRSLECWRCPSHSPWQKSPPPGESSVETPDVRVIPTPNTLWKVVSNPSLFLKGKNDYPPGNTNISPTSRHLWVDVPNFPFGGSKQEFPGVTSSPSIKSNTGSSRRTIW